MAGADTAKLVAELSLKDKLTPGVNNAVKSVGKLEKSVGKLGKSQALTKAAFRGFQGTVNESAKGFNRMAGGAGQLVGGLTRLGALSAGAVAVGLGAAGKAAIDFEDAFAGVRKTVDAKELDRAGLSFDKLKKQFIDLSTTIPVTASDLARIGEAAGALGIRATDISKFSETVAKLGATTNLTTDEAANSLGKIGTILGLTGKQFEDFGDILVNLGNKGASTEVEIIEITKRFAAAGKSAGLSTAQILGFASAISSAGVEPEAAGGALSRLFGKIVQETALATDKGKAFAKVSGKAFKDFSKVVKKDTAGAMLTFIKSLSKLDKFDQAKALKSVGITNTRDINAIRLLAQTYEKNLIPALKNAEDSAGALDKEASVRFDTIKSKFQLLKNALIKGGIEIGDGFLPALGRLTTKVTDFVNTNSGKLQKIGVDIGKALDDIDWKEVERGAIKVADAAQVILDVVKQIPTEVKLGGLAFIGLDKASGGLLGKGVGNIVGGAAGGIGGALADRFFARGSSPANPVFVSGGGGIGGGVGGGKGGIPPIVGGAGALLGIGLGPVLAAALQGVAQKVAADEFNKALEKRGITSNFAGVGAGPASIIPSLQLLAEAIRVAGLGSKPRGPNITGPSDRQLEGSAFRPNPAKPTALFKPDAAEARKNADKITAATDRTTTAVETMRGNLNTRLPADAQIVKAAIARTGIEIKGQTKASGITAALASTRAADRLAAVGRGTTRAVDRKDLSVTVKTTTIIRPSIREQAHSNSKTTHQIY